MPGGMHHAIHELETVPRVPLGLLPTPLVPAPRLAEALGRSQLWIKRDDMTGFGFGGNKVRGLEYLLADALAQHAHTLVTGAGPQSNHVRATVAAARSAGLDAVAVYFGSPPSQVNGNLRLVHLLGAEVRFTGDADRASVDRAIEQVTAELGAAGRRPYAIPRGGASAIGALGYVRAAAELAEQCRALDIHPDAIVLATGSCGTQAGLLAGLRALGLPWRVEGFTVSRPASEARTRVLTFARSALNLLDLYLDLSPDEVIVHDGFIGPGYGVPTPEGTEAIRLAARCEGLFLDPTYTGKAMAGLIAYARAGHLSREDSIIFLHTGGEPALFAGDGSWLNE